MYDLLIIGGGPAGTAAGVYAARKQLKTILVTTEFGGQSVVSSDIQNWIGTPSISGMDLARSFQDHLKANEGPFLEIRKNSKGIVDLSASDNVVTATFADGSTLQTKSVLIASGSNRRKLEIPGADIYENKGVVYCASCDGPLFADMDVVVVGGGNAGFESALQLLAYCKSVTMIHRSEEFRADEITVAKTKAHPNFSVRINSEPVEIKGEHFVTSMTVKNKVTGELEEIPTQGVFVEVGQIPNTEYAKNVVKRDEINRIIIDPWTSRSSNPLIWAAGDCSNIKYHQNNIAAGYGVIAVEDIYLALHRGV